MAMDRLAQHVIRPKIEAAGIPWYWWHGFRRAIASNLFALGADEKVVQRVLRHAKPHVTKDRYIKVFDAAVLSAMAKMQTTLETLQRGTLDCWPERSEIGQQAKRSIVVN